MDMGHREPRGPDQPGEGHRDRTRQIGAGSAEVTETNENEHTGVQERGSSRDLCTSSTCNVIQHVPMNHYIPDKTLKPSFSITQESKHSDIYYDIEAGLRCYLKSGLRTCPNPVMLDVENLLNIFFNEVT